MRNVELELIINYDQIMWRRIRMWMYVNVNVCIIYEVY